MCPIPGERQSTAMPQGRCLAGLGTLAKTSQQSLDFPMNCFQSCFKR